MTTWFIVAAAVLVTAVIGPALAGVPGQAARGTAALVFYDRHLNPTVLAEKVGVTVVEDYGSFGLCTLTPTQRGRLEAAGATLLEVPGLIRLRAAEFDPLRGGPAVEASLQASYGDGAGYYLVQFIGPIKAEWRERLAAVGEIAYYIPEYAYLVKLDAAARAEVSGWREVRWVGAYHPAYRLAPGVLEATAGDFVVDFFPGASGVKALEALGLEVKTASPVRAVVSGAPGLLKAAAVRDEVMWIAPYSAPRLYNNVARTVIKSDVCHTKGVLADGQVVAITDTGIWTAHEVFSEAGKVKAFIDIVGDSASSGGDGHGHGTHCSGSVLGDAPAYHTYNGYDGQGLAAQAVAVKVFDNSGYWGGGSDYYGFWDQAYAQGARVNSNSWGSDSGGYYDDSCHDADRITWDHRDYVLSIAAGNSGSYGSNTVGAPASAKNIMTVGATETAAPENVAYFSSRGPTDDNRIKPDVMAPGSYIRSAQRGVVDGYVDMQGTSMATPQNAGAAALVRDYFMQGFYPTGTATPADAFAPSAALVKAVLINGCREMTGTRSDWNGEGVWPNNAQGWGQLHLDRSLYFAGDTRSLKVWDSPASLSTGQTWTGTVDLADGTHDLKFTLAWTDYPAAVGAAVTLVNNLDLKVTAPDGTVFNGNNFAGINAGYSAPGGTPDARNTVEGVHLQPKYSFAGNLPTGTYTVTVTATNMAQPTSNFAVVATHDVSDAPPPPPPPFEQVAVMGDYNGQIEQLLESRGYTVRAYSGSAYAQVIANLSVHEVVVLHDVDNVAGFDDLLNACNARGRGIVFASAYPVSSFGMGVLSARKLDPASTGQDWADGPVQLRVQQAHPIFQGYSVGQTVTIINGGDNDYQTYDGYTGTNLAANAMPYSLPWMVGCKDASQTGGARHAVMGSFGCTSWTNMAHWTTDGKNIFCNAVEWCRGAAPPPPPPAELHVQQITMALVGKTNVYATATPKIVDEYGSPVADATVYGQWSGATNDSDSGVTDSNGQVTLQSNTVKKPPAGTTWTFTVTDVVKSGMTFVPGPNDSNSITR
ncbi:MAG: S8 family serine peptidase [Acetobacteraceae bacterium]|nr:S8 family serine peptidase [Acetobacteraceae bacterium]